ncbi:TetR/AcrR family transcriptional regulator [Stomatohabitans albus]|uniref:TetR/AcrR family transcriptional regulator n=1 Tax=Stomatohabitans albus TaxID=3110766 RepID=UPI00300C0960
MNLDSAVPSKAQRTRDALRNAARTAFVQNGWAGTRVNDITSLAQVSHGTFYTYYENREAVLDELISEVVTPLIDLAASPWRAQNPTDGLRSLIEAFLDVHVDAADILEVWRQASADQQRFAQSWTSVHKAFTSRIIQRLEGLARVVGTPCKPDAIQDTAEILVSMVASHNLTTTQNVQSRQRVADAMMMIWGGAINQLLDAPVIERPQMG